MEGGEAPPPAPPQPPPPAAPPAKEPPATTPPPPPPERAATPEPERSKSPPVKPKDEKKQAKDEKKAAKDTKRQDPEPAAAPSVTSERWVEFSWHYNRNFQRKRDCHMIINGDTIVTFPSLVENISSFSPHKIWEIRHHKCICRNTAEVNMQNKRLTQLSSKAQMLLFRVLVVFAYDEKKCNKMRTARAARMNVYRTCDTNAWFTWSVLL